MRLDELLPTYEFNEIHNIDVNASPEQVFTAIKNLTPAELSPLIFWMINLRALPAKILGQEYPSTFHEGAFLDQLLDGGFIPLGEQPPEEVVFGLIGQFWKLSGGEEPPVPIPGPEAFLSFADPAYAKVAANLYVDPSASNGTTRCSTETRIHVPDPKTRRKFALYWRLISMGSGWIRILWLRAIKRKAEAAAL